MSSPMGCHDQTVLTPCAYVDALARDSRSFIDLVGTADHERPVPFCRDWNLGELARHLGGIHRWAHDVVVTGAPGEEPEGPTDRHQLSSWLTEGAHQLHEVLSTTDPQSPTWTFGPKPRLVEFWIRRQALETFVHLWDVQSALGLALTIDDELTRDGIDEVVTMFFPRQVRLGRTEPLTHAVALQISDGQPATLVLTGDGTSTDAIPAATIVGTAAELLKLVWGRLDVEHLHVDGDRAAVDALVRAHLTP